MTLIERIPRYVITALLTLAIINLLIGVILRYVVGGITDFMDWDPVPFTWVEEVGETALAWMTFIGAAIGIRSRSHFMLQVITHHFSPAVQRAIDVANHLVIAGIGLLTAWYAVGLCRINWTLKTPGLEISLAVLYASAVVGGVLIAIYAIAMIFAPPPGDAGAGTSH